MTESQSELSLLKSNNNQDEVITSSHDKLNIINNLQDVQNLMEIEQNLIIKQYSDQVKDTRTPLQDVNLDSKVLYEKVQDQEDIPFTNSKEQIKTQKSVKKESKFLEHAKTTKKSQVRESQVKLQMKQHQQKEYISSQSVYSPNSKTKSQASQGQVKNKVQDNKQRDKSKAILQRRRSSNITPIIMNQRNNYDKLQFIKSKQLARPQTELNNRKENEMENIQILEQEQVIQLQFQDEDVIVQEQNQDQNYGSNESRTRNYLECMRTQYGNSTRNSLVNQTTQNTQINFSKGGQLHTSQSMSQFLNATQKSHQKPVGDINQFQIDLNYNDIQLCESKDHSNIQQIPFRKKRTSHTPNNMSYNKSRQLGFFINGLQSGKQRMSLLEGSNTIQDQPQNMNESFDESKNRRSISRQRRLMNMNEQDRKAFLQECVSVQDLVRASVNNLNKIIKEVSDSQSVNEAGNSFINLNKIKKTQSSPMKKSMTQVELSNALNQVKVLKIQRWYKHQSKVRQLLKIIRALSRFRRNLLTSYKGWIVRSRIFRNSNIVKQAKLIKYQRNKLLQVTYLNSKIKMDKQANIKRQIRENVQKLILMINNFSKNRAQAFNTARSSQHQSDIPPENTNSNQRQQKKSEIQPRQQALSKQRQRAHLPNDKTTKINQLEQQPKLLSFDANESSLLRASGICQSPRIQQKHHISQDFIISNQSSPASSHSSEVVITLQNQNVNECLQDSIEQSKTQKASQKFLNSSKSRYLNSKTPTNKNTRTLTLNKHLSHNKRQNPQLKPSQVPIQNETRRQKLSEQKDRIAQINREISAQRLSQSFVQSFENNQGSGINEQQDYLDCQINLIKSFKEIKKDDIGITPLKKSNQKQNFNESNPTDQQMQNQQELKNTNENSQKYNESLEHLKLLVDNMNTIKQTDFMEGQNQYIKATNEFESLLINLRNEFYQICSQNYKQ